MNILSHDALMQFCAGGLNYENQIKAERMSINQFDQSGFKECVNDDDDNDDVDNDLYIMGAVCLCVCYVFSYFNYFGR